MFSQMQTRRDFLRTVGLATAAGFAPRIGRAEPPSHPNILYVFSDQHRAAAMGCYGNTEVNTTNFDAFAAQGARLDAAISTTPVCCPHRACLMTGQYSHHHGMISNYLPIYPNAPCLAETFRDAGYTTGYIGKWHLEFPVGDLHSGPGASRRFGFDDYWRMAVEDKTHTYTDAYQYYDDDGVVHDSDTGKRQPVTMADQAIAFIQGHATEPTQPWLLMVGLGPPHTPFSSPLASNYPNPTLRPNVPGGEPASWAADVLDDYYGLIEELDIQFGRILTALAGSGLADNTIVVYSADHGEMLGSHGHRYKRWPYDYSAGVPFLIRYPGVISAGSVLDDPFGTPDVYTTLAGLAGITIPAPTLAALDGADFSALLRGETSTAPRDYTYMAMVYGYVAHPGWRAIRTADYLYARTVGGPWLLFDVKSDPLESNNLANQQSARSLVQSLDAELTTRMAELGDSWTIRSTADPDEIDKWKPGGHAATSHQFAGFDWPGRIVNGFEE